MKANIAAIVDQVGRTILGKKEEIELALTCLFADGHLLIEDLPGIGKTTLAHALARTLGLSFRRIQFTSDLLPGDILGVSVYDRQNAGFVFHPGPIFTQVLLTDEINRASPKTQSALLEAMEERQVTVEGSTRPLSRPFLVIATQNPQEQAGTFPLPESQLDRFLMRISLGYPDRESELELLARGKRKPDLSDMEPLLTADQVIDIQGVAAGLTVKPPLLAYIRDILEATRTNPVFLSGLSPRAGLALLRAARSFALVNGREYVLPEDVQSMFGPVLLHRLKAGEKGRLFSTRQTLDLLHAVPVP